MQRLSWPEKLSVWAWLRDRGWMSNLRHFGAAAVLGFIASLGGSVIFGICWGAGLALIGTSIQYWQCRRANEPARRVAPRPQTPFAPPQSRPGARPATSATRPAASSWRRPPS